MRDGVITEEKIKRNSTLAQSKPIREQEQAEVHA